MEKVNISRETIESTINQGAKSISQIYKMLGNSGNISGSTAKKIRELMPDNPNQKHKQSQGFKTAFIKAREKAGIPYLTSHGLRHYFCSHGMMSGVSKDVLRIQVGHASTQMLEQIYGHLSPEYQAQEMKKFSFFHPNNGSKSEETPKNIQSQEPSGSPVGAPEGKTGKGNGESCLL